MMISSCLGVLLTDGQTDGRMDKQTFVIVESLSRLKTFEIVKRGEGAKIKRNPYTTEY